MSADVFPASLVAEIRELRRRVERLEMGARATGATGLPLPRVTQAERLALPALVGLVVYQTDGTEGVYVYRSTGWAVNT